MQSGLGLKLPQPPTVNLNNKTTLSTDNLVVFVTDEGNHESLGKDAGEYPSVPYDWGGADSIEAYKKKVSEKQACRQHQR